MPTDIIAQGKANRADAKTLKRPNTLVLWGDSITDYYGPASIGGTETAVTRNPAWSSQVTNTFGYRDPSFS